jgi:hypothetical protein
MEVSGQLHAPAALPPPPPGKNLRYALDRRLSGPLSRYGRGGEEEKIPLLPLTGLEPWSFSSYLIHCTDWYQLLCAMSHLLHFKKVTLTTPKNLSTRTPWTNQWWGKSSPCIMFYRENTTPPPPAEIWALWDIHWITFKFFPPSARVKKVWSYSSTLPYVLMVWRLITRRVRLRGVVL